MLFVCFLLFFKLFVLTSIQAFAFLREKVKIFFGNPICARIKSTSLQLVSSIPRISKQSPYAMQSTVNRATNAMQVSC